MFKCPVCHERHSVPDNYDNKEYICLNTANRKNQKIFQDMMPTTILSSNNMLNTRSTKVDEARAATILIDGPSYNSRAEKIGTLPGKNY